MTDSDSGGRRFESCQAYHKKEAFLRFFFYIHIIPNFSQKGNKYSSDSRKFLNFRKIFYAVLIHSPKNHFQTIAIIFQCKKADSRNCLPFSCLILEILFAINFYVGICIDFFVQENFGRSSNFHQSIIAGVSDNCV